MASPIVVPLGLNGTNPAIIFTSFTGSTYNDNGVLRVVDAVTGDDLWSATSALHYVSPLAGLAAGDIDGDGYVEIVAVTATSMGGGTIVFEHDGVVKWISPFPISALYYRTIAISDLDRDGTPEIISGRTVLDPVLGDILWEGTGPFGYLQPIPVDLNQNGMMEVIAGTTVYANDGHLMGRTGYRERHSSARGYRGN